MKIREKRIQKPHWLKATIGGGKEYTEIRTLVDDNNLHTVCKEARCPNLGECWSKGVATFMILGGICTRHCSFCNVESGKPGPVDLNEPIKIARSAQAMKLKYVTLTSVTRDDLTDKGTEIWAQTILKTREINPEIKIEVLTPDFNGRLDLLDIVLESNPDVFNHNLETVYRLQKTIRKKANWHDSFGVLDHAKIRGFTTKTGLMVGLGETKSEVFDYIDEVAEHSIDILTIGQYLRPAREFIEVDRYVHPDEFDEYAVYAKSKGIKKCMSGPLVRSSYMAGELEESDA
ncbi:MAG: lipoyl synthase [Fibrobacterales bacterium]